MSTAIKGSLAITIVAIAALGILGIFGFLPSKFIDGGWIRLAIGVAILFAATFALIFLTSKKE